jgi:hypothetical protein
MAFAFSWALWWVAASLPGQSAFLTWLGGFGPALAAFVLTGLFEGSGGLRCLLARAFVWKIHPGVYLAVLGIPVAGTVALMALYSWSTGDPGSLQSLPGWFSELIKNSPTYDGMVMYASATLPFLRQAHGYELVVVLVLALGIVAWHGPGHFQASQWRRNREPVS